jgi:hypothetical protein
MSSTGSSNQRIVMYLCIPLLVLQVGCSSRPNTDMLFHELAIPESERINSNKTFELQFNAYVIGVEKANKGKIGFIDECKNGSHGHCINTDAVIGLGGERLKEELRDIYSNQLRPTFVSHIAKFTSTRGTKPCFTYNMYEQTQLCGSHAKLPLNNGQYLTSGWDALLDLTTELDNDILSIKPTHLIVYFMGWNTPQWEAMKNYRDLFGNLLSAAKEHNDDMFRPLFFGVTWPSTGTPIVDGSDYGIKGKDADEVGMIWGNILINHVLGDLKAKYGMPIIVIGHSFGARASSRAVFSAPLLPNRTKRKNVNLLLGLQGAYSFERYVPGAGIEGSPYSHYSEMAEKVVLTSSEYDTAVTKAGRAAYFVGSNAVYNKTKLPQYSPYFEHVVTGKQNLEPIPSCDPSKITLVDASSVINQNQPGTGGGAHSYIYTIDVGRLTYQLIAMCQVKK